MAIEYARSHQDLLSPHRNGDLLRSRSFQGLNFSGRSGVAFLDLPLDCPPPLPAPRLPERRSPALLTVPAARQPAYPVGHTSMSTHSTEITPSGPERSQEGKTDEDSLNYEDMTGQPQQLTPRKQATSSGHPSEEEDSDSLEYEFSYEEPKGHASSVVGVYDIPDKYGQFSIQEGPNGAPPAFSNALQNNIEDEKERACEQSKKSTPL